MLADLHIHTDASDGRLNPAEAVKWAKTHGIEIMSITDHDTVDGLLAGERAAREAGIKFVRGVEISAKLNFEVHILGYGIDIDDPKFLKGLDEVRRLRAARNAEIAERLERYGVKPDMDFEAAGVGRMNIARKMVEQGYCRDITEAFDKYLGTSGKAYCDMKRTSPADAVRLIAECGGFASLAHPKRLLLDGRLDKLLAELKPCGLRGLEVNYPSHYDSDRSALRALCKKYGLLPTGGSDYHGDEDKNFVFHLDSRVIEALKI